MASNPDVEVVRRSCRYMDGTQDLDIPVQQSNVNSIKRLDVRKLIYDTINLSYIPELVPEERHQPLLAQGLPAEDSNVPVSPQMASSSLSPDVPHSASSAPLTSLTPGNGNELCTDTYNSASPAPRCPNINQQMSFRQQFPASYSVTSPAPRGVILNHQMSLRQPCPVPYNTVQPAPRSADINQLLSFRPSFPTPHKVAPPASIAPPGGNNNHQMSFRQSSPVPSNCTPPASGWNYSSSQMNVSHPPPASNNSMFFARSTAPTPKRCVRLSKQAKEIMNKWFDLHIEHPYPDEESVEMLSIMCNITAKKVQKWCSNKRMRSKEQPKLEPPTCPTTSVSEYSFVDLRNACD